MHPSHPVGAHLGRPRKLLIVAAIVAVQSLVSLAEVRAQPGPYDVALGRQYVLDVDMTVVAHCACEDRSVRLREGVVFELRFEARSEDGHTIPQSFIIASGERFVPPATGKIVGRELSSSQRLEVPPGCRLSPPTYHHFDITPVTP